MLECFLFFFFIFFFFQAEDGIRDYKVTGVQTCALDTYAKRYGAKVLVDPNTIPNGWTLVVPWAAAGLGALGAAWMLWRWRAARLAMAAPSDAGGLILPDIPYLDDE